MLFEKTLIPWWMILSILNLVFFVNTSAQNVGDILFTGYNADGSQSFSFMATTSIAPSTQIRFTDRGWTGSALRTGDGTEGELLYTVGAGGLFAGDQIAIDLSGPSISSGGGSLSSVSGTVDLDQNGDQLIAFVGAAASPTTFLAGIQMEGTSWDVTASSNNTSALPTGLTGGSTGFYLNTERDNATYDCVVTSGSAAALLAAISDVSNWNGNNGSAYSLPCSSTTATTWNGSSWTGGTPSAADDAIIASSTALSAALTCRGLTINSGVTLDIGSNNATISGNIVNDGNGISGTGTITFNKAGNTFISGDTLSYGSIIEVASGTTLRAQGLLKLTATSASNYGQIVGDGSVSGDVLVEAYVDPSPARYFFLGSPCNNALLEEFNEGNIMKSASDQTGTVWEWNSSASSWDAPGDVSSTTAVSGQGYAIYVGTNSRGTFIRPNAGQISITGEATMSDITIPLNYHNGQGVVVGFVGGTSISATQGWNLLSNPFPATYDWDSQTIPTDMASAIYRFDGTNYSSYTKGVGSGSRYIAPYQGFFVQLTANTPGNITFAAANRSPSQSGTLSKTLSYPVDGVDLHVYNPQKSIHDELYVGFDPLASPGFDTELDAQKLENSTGIPNVFTQLQGENLSINRVSLNDGITSFPVWLEHSSQGDSLLFELDPSRLKSFEVVEIEDLKLGTRHNLVSSSYLFINDTTYRKDRFVLHFTKRKYIGLSKEEIDAIWSAFPNENGVTIDLGNIKARRIEVIDLSGRVLKMISDVQTITKINLESGLYIIRVIDNQGSSSKRIFL